MTTTNVVSANFVVGNTTNGTSTITNTVQGVSLNVSSGTNTIKIWSDGNSNAKLVRLRVGANVATYLASGTTTINGGQIHAGSDIKIGNVDGFSDYCSITKGDITFYKYFSNLGHKPTKSLKRLEIGTATSGVEKELPGYWAEKPQIFLSPNSIQTYVKDASAQNQILTCPNPAAYQKSTGKWAFVPQIMLIVSEMDGLGNIMPINYTDMLASAVGGNGTFQDWDEALGTRTGTEYDITESNIVGMRVQVDLRAIYYLEFTCNSSTPRPYSVYHGYCYVRIGYYVINTWLSTDWVLFKPEESAYNLWEYITFNIDIPEQSDEISKIRVEVKAYNEPARYSKSDHRYCADTTNGLGTGLSIESVLVSYTGSYGADSVIIEGDVNYIAISEG